MCLSFSLILFSNSLVTSEGSGLNIEVQGFKTVLKVGRSFHVPVLVQP